MRRINIVLSTTFLTILLLVAGNFLVKGAWSNQPEPGAHGLVGNLRAQGSLNKSGEVQVSGPISTAFTYQGSLMDNGQPANGPYDFIFTLYPSLEGGSQVGPVIEVGDVPVHEGLFNVDLNFEQGSILFDGTAYWLEIGVRPGDEIGDYGILSPRQEIMATPYATYASRSTWQGLSDIPAGFEDDVDDDSLATLGCDDGLIPRAGGGDWVCDAEEGDISAVNPGNGLEGGGEFGTVSLEIAGAFQLPQGCANGEIPEWTGSTWRCSIDDLGQSGGGGDITGVLPGYGLEGGGEIGTVTLDVVSTTIQSRVVDGCPVGSSIRQINQDGSVTCEIDQDTTYAAGIGLDLDSLTISITSTYQLPQACQADQVARWDNSNQLWVCDYDLDTTDDLVSFDEIAGIVGTASGTVAAGDHNHEGIYADSGHDHDGRYFTQQSLISGTAQVDWANLRNIPSGLEDGDDDTLAGILCSDNQIIKWLGGTWTCAADEIDGGGNGGDITAVFGGLGLTGDATSGDATLDVGAGTGIEVTADAVSIAGDYRLPQLCTDDQVAKWNDAAGNWECAVDIDTDRDTTYSAGSGLDLSGTIISITDTYQLPQLCENGQLPKWNSAIGLWECAADIDTDTNTTYAAGSGLDLSGTTFSISDTYQLPQLCEDGQLPKWNTASGNWECAADIDTDTDTTYSAGTGLVLSGTTFVITNSFRLPQGCTGGQIISWDGFAWTCDDLPVGSGEGWSLTGNAGTSAASNFLGTIDGESLTFRVNNEQALLLDPTGSNSSPNFIAGYGGNQVGGGTVGATVGGGGRDLAINQANGDYSTVDGGAGNTASGYASAVAGGEGNSAAGSRAATAGGAGNSASGDYASVSGGQDNTASGSRAAVGGGYLNIVSQPYGAVSGGANNTVMASFSVVGGGAYNEISGTYGTIGGGGPSDTGNPTTSRNLVSDDYGTVSGGGGNTAGNADGDSTNADFATVGGGQNNNASAASATVAGGSGNTAAATGATVGGGNANAAEANYATVAGGIGNTAEIYATVGGGRNNVASGAYATVGGGYNNQVTAAMGTIPGGINNYVGGNYGFAAGNQARAEHPGSFVWSDSQVGSFSSTGPDQFLIDASNGVGIGTNDPSSMLTVNGSSEILNNGQLTLRSVITIPSLIVQEPSAVYAAGTDVFVTSEATNTLTVIDVTDPSSPRFVAYGTSQLQRPVDVHVVGQRAYVASQDANAIVAFDVSDPAQIDDALGDAVWGLDAPVAIYVSGNDAFVASQGNNSVVIFDVTDIRNMFPTSTITDSLDAPSDIYISEGYAYITSRNNDLLAVFDLRGSIVTLPDRLQPTLAGTVSTGLDAPVAVHVRNNHAFVLSANNSSLVAFNISNKAHITATGRISTSLTKPRSLYVSGDYAYVAYEGDDGTSANCGLAVFDISDPENMQVLQVIDMSDSEPEPEKPVGIYGSGNYIYVVNERHWSLAIYEVNNLQAPAATVGTLRTGYLEVNDNALVNNDLIVDGGLNVGGGGAWIGGELSVAGTENSYIMGGLSVGEAAKTLSVTFGTTDYDVLLPYPTHLLDVHGDARFRVNAYNNIVIDAPRGFDEDASIDFFQTEVIEEDTLTEVITPSASIRFDAIGPFTRTAGIKLYTRDADDPEMSLRLSVTEGGQVLPGVDQVQNLGGADYRWLKVYTRDGVDQISDSSYKEHIESLVYGLDEVTALQPVSFNWRDGQVEELHFGLVAQEVAEVLPELVSGGDGGQPLSLNYSELTPVLVNAIQEQQEEIDNQAQQIASLEARLDALETGSSSFLSGFSPTWGVLFIALAVVVVGSRNRWFGGRP